MNPLVLLAIPLTAAGLGGVVWELFAPGSFMRQSFENDPYAREWIESVAAADEPVWDLGPMLPRGLYHVLRIVSAGVVGLIVLLATHNGGEMIGMAVLGSTLPRYVLDRLRHQRRLLLDSQAYSMASTLRLLLPVSANLVDALRDAQRNAEPPLSDLLLKALQAETRVTGSATEFLRQAGRDLKLHDLELLGDVLYQVRTQTPRAGALIDNLTEMWGQRLAAAQRRLGRMSGAVRLGTIMIGVSVLIQVAWPAVSPATRALDGHVMAQMFGLFASMMTFAAWSMILSQTHKAITN